MDITDLKNWPEGAKLLIDERFFCKWVDGIEYNFFIKNDYWEKADTQYEESNYNSEAWDCQYRPDPWAEGEERMAVIPQNGNDGEHYEEVDNLEKQPRYTDEDGLDWIDEFAANNSIEDFRAAMRFTIGKYDRRLGKKDELSKELYKISDYYQRWSKIEKELESK
jgi:hypothetical protein